MIGRTPSASTRRSALPLNDDGSAAPHVADEVRTLVLLAAALFFAPGYIFAAPPARAEGIYTAAQAARGKEVYSASCASCHAADLSGGGTSPPLAGPAFVTSRKNAAFAADWGSAVFTADDLLFVIRTTMPRGAAGSLGRRRICRGPSLHPGAKRPRSRRDDTPRRLAAARGAQSTTSRPGR